MKLSYEGIGQWAATFAASDVAEGELVKISANGTVGSLARRGTPSAAWCSPSAGAATPVPWPWEAW